MVDLELGLLGIAVEIAIVVGAGVEGTVVIGMAGMGVAIVIVVLVGMVGTGVGFVVGTAVAVVVGMVGAAGAEAQDDADVVGAESVDNVVVGFVGPWP